jgi:NAD(P)-dependent dehydrogenase (short-subunit alcohol dehydrogenase family)
MVSIIQYITAFIREFNTKVLRRRVYASCRAASTELKNLNFNGGLVIEGADVSSEEGINSLRAAVGRNNLDLLINNAGILEEENIDSLDFDCIRRQFEVNSMGPLRVTSAMRPHLHMGSKVAIITSRMGSLADNSSGGFYGYRMSKAAVNMAAVTLARDMEPAGVVVVLLHPGMVDTDMTAQFGGGIPASESAAGLLKRIEEATMATSGRFFHANGEELPW